MHFDKVGFIGLGLIGGSIGHSWRPYCGHAGQQA